MVLLLLVLVVVVAVSAAAAFSRGFMSETCGGPSLIHCKLWRNGCLL